MMTLVQTILVCGLIGLGSTLPAQKLLYYQQPMPFYNGGQRMMYVQYVQPSRMFARSTQAAEALVAGDRIATGTYLKDCDYTETDIAAAAGPAPSIEQDYYKNIAKESSSSGAGIHNSAQSFSEAYPAGNVPLIGGIPVDVDVVPEENEVSIHEEEINKKTANDFNVRQGNDVTESHVQNESETQLVEGNDNAVDEEQQLLIHGTSSHDQRDNRMNKHRLVTPASDTEVTRFSSSKNTIPIGSDSLTTQYDINISDDVNDTDADDDDNTSKIDNRPNQGIKVPQQKYLPATKGSAFQVDSTIDNEDNEKSTIKINKMISSATKKTVGAPKRKLFVELDTTDGIENGLHEARLGKENKNVKKDDDVNNDDNNNDDDNDESNDDDQDEDENEEELEEENVPTVTKKTNRQWSRKNHVARKTFKANQDAKPSRPSPSSGTFFPVEFGGTGGGAFAIANSFSTGEGGSATSHAIAYGSPDAIRSQTRARPSKLH